MARIRTLVLAVLASALLIVGTAIPSPAVPLLPILLGSSTQSSTADALPAHVLTGYWQNFANSSTKPLRLSQVPRYYDIIAVAFADVDPIAPGAAVFSVNDNLSNALGGYTNAQFKADIATKHAQGKKVILSIGGQNGTLTVDDPITEANFVNSINGLMQQYGFDGVDIDMEHGINVSYLADALHHLDRPAGGLIVTLAPSTYSVRTTTGDYFQLARDISDILTVMNTQYYDSNPRQGCDGNLYSEGSENFLTTQVCKQMAGGIPASQLGLGIRALTPTARALGDTSAPTENNALNCLASKRNCDTFVPSTAAPDIRGAMIWSINWDADGGYAFGKSISQRLHTLP